MKVTKDMIISDVLDMDKETAVFFFNIGMHCIYCPASMGETLEEACMVHGVSCDELVETLNNHFSALAPAAAEAVNEG